MRSRGYDYFGGRINNGPRFGGHSPRSPRNPEQERTEQVVQQVKQGSGDAEYSERSGSAESNRKFQTTSLGQTQRNRGLRTTGITGRSSKIIVTNLDYGVTDADIMELFSEVGELTFASIHYNYSGKSMGKADVVFKKSEDAQKAINKYNGVPLDGRSMVITYANATPWSVMQVRSAGLRSIRKRIGPKVEDSSPRVVRDSNYVRGGRGFGRPAERSASNGGDNRGRSYQEQEAKIIAELDAEMEEYIRAKPN